MDDDDVDDMPDNVVPIHKWTREEYLAKKKQLLATYGQTAQDAGGRREQEFARLYNQSGWTQQEIADIEGMNRKTTERWLRFGEFLDFDPPLKGENAPLPPIPAKLTERTFRRLWESTANQGNKFQRFIAIRRSLAAGTEAGLMTSNGRLSVALGKQILEHIADTGKYMPLVDLVEKVGQPEPLVRAAIEKLETSKDVRIETKRQGTHSFKVRAFRNIAPVPYAELKAKLMPILEKAEENAKKHKALIVPSLFADFAHMLRTFLAEWEA